MMKYPFKILHEEVAEEDKLNSGTHQSLANTIESLLKENDRGLTIGLEGEYGSGKSTVVKLLTDKLKEEKDFQVFYFDSWAHEGDSLRRSFLISMINQVEGSEKNKALKKIRSEVENRVTRNRVKIKRSPTLLGYIVSLLAFFVPLGIALLSTISEICVFGDCGPVNWIAITGIVLTIMPLIGVAIYAFGLGSMSLVKGKNLFTKSRWSFLQKDSNEKIRQKTKGSYEKSSLEFQDYFNQIIGALLRSKGEGFKILLIIDNLDRVADNTLVKVVSSLQTFLQHRNSLDESHDNFKKNVFVLIPFNDAKLRFTGRGNSTFFLPYSFQGSQLGQSVPIEISNSANSVQDFLEKYFEVRLTVPPTLLRTWDQLLESLLNDHFEGWEEDDRNLILNVYRNFKNDSADISTPRDIKRYLNQVGLLRNHLEHLEEKERPSLEAICYYVIFKYCQGEVLSQDYFVRKLIGKEIPESNHVHFLTQENMTEQLASIVYDVRVKDAYEVLLYREIQECLASSVESKRLKEFKDLHGQSFWMVFKKVIDSKYSNQDLIRCSLIIKTIFGIQDPNLKEFKSIVNAMNWSDSSHLDLSEEVMDGRYEATIDFLSKENCQALLNKIGSDLENHLAPAGASLQNISLRGVLKILDHANSVYKLEALNILLATGIWEKVAKITFKEKLRCYNYLKPRIVNQRNSEYLQKFDSQNDSLPDVYKYFFLSGIFKEDEFIETYFSYLNILLKTMDRESLPNIKLLDLGEIFLFLSFKSQNMRERVREWFYVHEAVQNLINLDNSTIGHFAFGYAMCYSGLENEPNNLYKIFLIFWEEYAPQKMDLFKDEVYSLGIQDYKWLWSLTLQTKKIPRFIYNIFDYLLGEKDFNFLRGKIGLEEIGRFIAFFENVSKSEIKQVLSVFNKKQNLAIRIKNYELNPSDQYTPNLLKIFNSYF